MTSTTDIEAPRPWRWLQLKNGWTFGHYELFRTALGLYLLAHFVSLIPWVVELFSSQGVLPEASASPFSSAFPNLLVWFDDPFVVVAVTMVACLGSALVALGRFDRVSAFVVWFVWACFFGRNPLISNPSIPYVGWLLLAHAAIPRPSKEDETEWRMPPTIFGAAWIVLMVGYSYSGIAKLTSPSWLDGSALMRVLESPLARPTALRTWLVELPRPWLAAATWVTLGLELLAAPLALSRRMRPWIWLGFVGLHVGILATVDFADLTLGMLMIHAFTFDPAWLSGEEETS